MSIQRWINGSHLKVPKLFNGVPIDQVFVEGRGWSERFDDVCDAGLLATLEFWHKGKRIMLHFCGEPYQQQARGDWTIDEILSYDLLDIEEMKR